jgi:antitoxin Phd
MAMASWQLQDAKAKFSEVVRLAVNDGPQVVTVRGVETVVVLSAKDYQKLENGKMSFVDYLMTFPDLDDETIAVINDRSQETLRDIDFDL